MIQLCMLHDLDERPGLDAVRGKLARDITVDNDLGTQSASVYQDIV